MENNIKDKIEKLETSIKNIDEKKNKIMFFLPAVAQASGGVGVVYNHVKRLTDLGYDAMVIHEDKTYIKPEWLGVEYTSLKHLMLNAAPLSVSPEDIIIFPEGFSNIMKQFEVLTCVKVVLCQSHAYVLASLVPNTTWADWGIKNVITVQEPLKAYLSKLFGPETYKITNVSPSVDENIFKVTGKVKRPVIAVSARDQSDILMLAKQFYATYPQYSMFSFKDMRDMSRADFASTLESSFLGVWIDRIAGFGTFPIECAKVGTPFVALIPDMIPEYAAEDKGIWVNSILDISDTIAGYVGLYLEDAEPTELLEGISELAKYYTKEDEDKNIQQVYASFLEERKGEMIKLLSKIKEEEQDGE